MSISSKKRYPVITAIGGRTYRVDACGLLDVHRQWPAGDPPDEEQIATAMRWLSRVEQIQTPSINSYSAKHAVERWLRLNVDKNYISNGAMIVAADRCGFRQSANDQSLNSELAISLQSYKRLPESAGNWNAMRVQP